MLEAARFPFGDNWRNFLRTLDESRIRDAEIALVDMLGGRVCAGRRFLDIGSGSGLSSLVALRLGAEVHSFDYDTESVACTDLLRQRYSSDEHKWAVEQGSVLDCEYVRSLGYFDIVYSWGVLHHTGDLWRALDCAAAAVSLHGTLYVALYNDQGWVSGYWMRVKRLYNRSRGWRWLMVALHAPYLLGLRSLVRLVRARWRLRRGMSLWHDMLDWLGGYPFEVAHPDTVVDFCRHRGFRLVKLKTVGRRHGCNDFVFERVDCPRSA